MAKNHDFSGKMKTLFLEGFWSYPLTHAMKNTEMQPTIISIFPMVFDFSIFYKVCFCKAEIFLEK